jgi:hypothetical protein
MSGEGIKLTWSVLPKDIPFDDVTLISGKALTSSGEKGSQLTQTTLESREQQIFTITEQNGSYRILDSAGFYVGVYGAKMVNGNGIGLWTEANDGSQTFVLQPVN